MVKNVERTDRHKLSPIQEALKSGRVREEKEVDGEYLRFCDGRNESLTSASEVVSTAAAGPHLKYIGYLLTVVSVEYSDDCDARTASEYTAADYTEGSKC